MISISRKVSDESLGRDETYVCKASHNIHCKILALFSNLETSPGKISLESTVSLEVTVVVTGDY